MNTRMVNCYFNLILNKACIVQEAFLEEKNAIYSKTKSMLFKNFKYSLKKITYPCLSFLESVIKRRLD